MYKFCEHLNSVFANSCSFAANNSTIMVVSVGYVVAKVWSSHLDILQCSQNPMAARQHSRSSAVTQ